MYKIVGADGKEYGPVTLEQLQQWAGQGRLSATTQVQNAATGEWRAAADCPEISGFLAVRVPTPGAIGALPATGGEKKGLAIASFVLGLGSFVFCLSVLGGIPAIILGHIAHARARRSPAEYGGAGFAVAGLVLGYLSVVLTALAVALVLPAVGQAKTAVETVACANNMKQIGLAFRVWATDHNDQFPFNVSTTNGGTLELCSRGPDGLDRNSMVHFLVMSNELNTPKILFCPAEYESSYRQAATSFSGVAVAGTVPYVNDMNVSYFVGVDAQETYPRMFLTGDHNLGGNANTPTTPFLAAPSTGNPFVYLGTNFTVNQGPAYMDTMHAKQGNVGMADGSVEFFSRTELQDALRHSGDKGRAAGPFVMGIGVTAGVGCNRIQLP